MTDTPEHAPADTAFADTRELLAIIASPDRHAALVRDLKGRIAAAEEGAVALGVERETFDAEIRERTAALNLEGQELAASYAALVARQKEIGPRKQRIADLYASWRSIAEDDFFEKGLRGPQHGDPLLKAQRGYNKLPEKPEPTERRAGADHVRPAHWLMPTAARNDRPYVPPPSTQEGRRRARRGGLA